MRHKIEAKIKRVRYYLSLLQSYKQECSERFKNDPMFEGALLHYLYLSSDGCIAIAEMMLRHRKIGASQSYYEAIDTLGEYGIIPKEFAYDFAKIASFRNFLAHDYEKIEPSFICDEALHRLDEIEKYLGYIEESLDT